MNISESFSGILLPILYMLPGVAVCAAGVVVVLSRSNQLRPAVPWALLGFGLSLFVGVVSPFAWHVVSRLLPGGASRELFHALLSVFWSFLHAASYGCLLVAILAGREKTPPLQPPVDPLARPRF
jgi:hypothetical protein